MVDSQLTAKPTVKGRYVQTYVEREAHQKAVYGRVETGTDELSSVS
jgi:hypothetical protein